VPVPTTIGVQMLENAATILSCTIKGEGKANRRIPFALIRIQLLMTEFKQNEAKLAELILYISQKCADDPCFGATKLNKILYFADFLHYGNYGKPITGVEYQKLPYGPAPRRLVPVRKQLVDNGELGIQPVELRSGGVQQKPVNLREPDLSIFSGTEIAQVDTVIQAFAGTNTDAISGLSHKMVGWQVVEENATIPYPTVFVSNPKLTRLEIDRGLEVAARLGL